MKLSKIDKMKKKEQKNKIKLEEHDKFVRLCWLFSPWITINISLDELKKLTTNELKTLFNLYAQKYLDLEIWKNEM